MQSQWAGSTPKDIYAIDVKTGERKLVKKNHEGNTYPSSTGKYILLYDNKAKHYFAWDGTSLKNITSKIKVPLYEEEHDSPNDPNPYGVMGWHEGDSAAYVYDRYDIWKVSLTDNAVQNLLRGVGRKTKTSYRQFVRDVDKKFFKTNEELLLRKFNNETKGSGLALLTSDKSASELANVSFNDDKFSISPFVTNKDVSETGRLIVAKESYLQSPDLYTVHFLAPGVKGSLENPHGNLKGAFKQISSLNPQQAQYNWGTAELFKWKAFNGKTHEGVLYKPENFDSTKKYPMLMYFYERHSDNLHSYIPPSPTPSRLNIPFYVSRGYVVFSPDIIYTKGHPAKDAYNAVVSAAQALSKKRWIDGKNIGIQGQSWGGHTGGAVGHYD